MRMRVLVIDDDRLITLSLRTVLSSDADTQVVAEGGSGEEAIALYRVHEPDILLMDIRMQGMSGLEAGEAILLEYPHARILFLTTFSDDEYIIAALRMGAKGYLLKQHYEAIGPAMRAVMQGQNVFGGEVVDKLPALMGRQPAIPPMPHVELNEREWELTRLVGEGLSNKEIAARLFLSDGTVRNYLSVLLEKLALRDRTQLAIYYYQNR